MNICCVHIAHPNSKHLKKMVWCYVAISSLDLKMIHIHHPICLCISASIHSKIVEINIDMSRTAYNFLK